ncbi:MAG: 2Fe-2S iron-sulfur cluster-binding protein [Planctomycetota bacterium]|nr:2Fe-2S iron-sulfur cluster-binding protein [Planctomycetota bacterium]
MATVLVDGIEIEIRDGERLNAIEAAARAGVSIPHYCWHPGLSVVGSCRMCLIEVGTRDAAGRIQMGPKLVPACNTLVRDGTVLVTQSEKVQQARAIVEEGLLLRHPIDCPICDKAGECLLQDYYFQYGQADGRRADIRPFTSRRRDLGDVTLFVDRCILCTRCVRFVREVSGTSELMVSGRATGEEIDVLEGFPLANKLSGNVVDLCPVGALADKDFLYRQRVWFLRSHPGVCTRCASGCSIWIDENQDRICRIRPRENPHVNRWWICNDGRYDYPHVHNPARLLGARQRKGGDTRELDFTGLADRLRAALQQAGRLGAVLSPFLTLQEAYLLARTIRQLDPQALLALGPVPRAGEDERYPGGFTISKEKCPNRCGVERILGRFGGGVIRFDQFAEQAGQGARAGAWVSGGYRQAWIDEETAAKFERLKLLVVQDLFPSPLSQRATYELGGAAFAERDGAYVNRQHRLQSVAWAIRPPAGVRTEGSILWELAGRAGLYDAAATLRELAAAIPFFHPALGTIPATGLDLLVNQIA